jgi:hypothetical protein
MASILVSQNITKFLILSFIGLIMRLRFFNIGFYPKKIFLVGFVKMYSIRLTESEIRFTVLIIIL